MARAQSRDTDDTVSADETALREEAVLKRLLATPPQPKQKVVDGASPKKRGRPPKGSGSPDAPARGSNEKADDRR